MAMRRINGVELFVREAGAGPLVVLLHGSWVDHHQWDLVFARLAERFRVIAYDRRGHSASGRLPRPTTVHDHVEDLAELIRQAEAGPARLVGNSFGAAITLRMAAKHPSLVQRVTAHEPPVIKVLDGDVRFAELTGRFWARGREVGALLERNLREEAARLFVNEIALGEGAWEALPQAVRSTFIANALTFLDEVADEETLALDLEALGRFEGRVLFTEGERSPEIFRPILDRVAASLPHAKRELIAGAGHVPQQTRPRDFLARIAAFLGE